MKFNPSRGKKKQVNDFKVTENSNSKLETNSNSFKKL